MDGLCRHEFFRRPLDQVNSLRQVVDERHRELIVTMNRRVWDLQRDLREIEEAGFPPGVLNLVNGGKEVVNAILEHPGGECRSVALFQVPHGFHHYGFGASSVTGLDLDRKTFIPELRSHHVRDRELARIEGGESSGNDLAGWRPFDRNPVYVVVVVMLRDVIQVSGGGERQREDALGFLSED